jgi:hypothetical protein
MGLHKILAAMLWPLAVLLAFAMAVIWVVDVQSGKLSAWAILPFFWGAAIVAIVVHYLGQWRDPLTRYLARHKPLAGPRPGAELPG